MKHISQPPGSNLCGQACVAMIAGVTLEKSIAVFGKRGETETREVIAALRKLGIKCGGKLQRMKKGVTPTPCCIMVLHYDGVPIRHWHWIVYYGGLYYDPAESIGIAYKAGVRITSYLSVYLAAQAEEDGQ